MEVNFGSLPLSTNRVKECASVGNQPPRIGTTMLLHKVANAPLKLQDSADMRTCIPLLEM